MGFTSSLYPGEEIFHDTSSDDSILMSPHGRGLVMPDVRSYAGVAEPFPSSMLIPRSEWQARIQEMEERKTRMSDMVLRANLPAHDQDGIPYCWIHGPTGALEATRVVHNLPMVLLSATSAGCKIKNFRSEGGWGKEGLEYIVKYGVVPQSMWPENQLKRQYDTPEAWREADKYRVTEWWVLQERNLDEQVSCLLHRMATAVGLNYWGHEVYDCEPVWIDGEVAIRFRNSWGDGWGSKGFGIRQGSKRFSDDSVVPRVAMAS